MAWTIEKFKSPDFHDRLSLVEDLDAAVREKIVEALPGVFWVLSGWQDFHENSFDIAQFPAIKREELMSKDQGFVDAFFDGFVRCAFESILIEAMSPTRILEDGTASRYAQSGSGWFVSLNTVPSDDPINGENGWVVYLHVTIPPLRFVDIGEEVPT